MSDILSISNNLGVFTMGGNIATLPVVFIIDSSVSMDQPIQGTHNESPSKIEQVRGSVEMLLDRVKEEDLPTPEYEFAHIDCGNDRVSIQQEFRPVEDFVLDIPEPSGSAPIGTAIIRAINLCDEREEYYKREALPFEPPMVVLLSDGNYDDMSRGDQRWTKINKLLDAFHQDDDRWKGSIAVLNFAYWAPSDRDVGPLSHLIRTFTLDVPPDGNKLHDFINPDITDELAIPPDERLYDCIQDVLTAIDVEVFDLCLECGENLSDHGTIDLNFCPVCGAEL